METLYAYKTPFNGRIQTTVHNNLVDYTGESKTRKYTDEKGCQVIEISHPNKLTFEQFNEQEGGIYKLATENEIVELLEKYENTLIGKFEEITEDSYMFSLECMPPRRWHKYNKLEIFFLLEAYTSNIHHCFIFNPSTQKYYKGLQRITATSEEIELTFKQSI